jgi:hypothetical protein
MKLIMYRSDVTFGSKRIQSYSQIVATSLLEARAACNLALYVSMLALILCLLIPLRQDVITDLAMQLLCLKHLAVALSTWLYEYLSGSILRADLACTASPLCRLTTLQGYFLENNVVEGGGVTRLVKLNANNLPLLLMTSKAKDRNGALSMAASQSMAR